MEALAETLTDPRLLVAVLSAIAAAGTVFTIAAPLLSGDRLKSRMKLVSTHREELRQRHHAALAERSNGPKLRAATPSAFVKRTVEQLKLRELLDEASSKKKLIMAGYRGQAPLFTFMFFRLATPFITAIAAGVYLFTVNDFNLPPFARLALSFGAFVVGFYLPSVYIQNVISKRQDALQIAFPDALDLLLICVESGMSIEAAFAKVTQEIGTTSIELAEEFSLTTAELSYLQDRKVAYQNLAERTGLDGIKAVATALIQSENYGTPLGQALRVMAQENRELRLQKAEKKAASLPAKLTVPMIVFFLPVLFVVIIGPSIISVMDAFADY